MGYWLNFKIDELIFVDILILLMLLKAATLQKISTKDLVTITVAQNSLENNF